MTVEASGVLLASPADVWKLVGEPYHLPDWWPGYQGVQPDRRGLADGARWEITRGVTKAATSGLLRRLGGPGVIVIRRVVPGSLVAWHDVEQRVDATVVLEPAVERRTQVTVTIAAPGWRIALEGLRGVPPQAVSRLYDLCQTAAEL